MTAERISELRELRAAADGGEWKPGRMDTESYDGDGTRQHKNIYADGRVVACGEGYSCRPNATLIAAVVNNLTELLTAAEEVEQSRKEIERLRVENELLREKSKLSRAEVQAELQRRGIDIEPQLPPLPECVLLRNWLGKWSIATWGTQEHCMTHAAQIVDTHVLVTITPPQTPASEEEIDEAYDSVGTMFNWPSYLRGFHDAERRLGVRQ